MAPPMDGPRDLLFAPLLASALERDLDDKAKASTVGKLAAAPWLARYERLTLLVQQTRTGWARVPTLLRERAASCAG